MQFETELKDKNHTVLLNEDLTEAKVNENTFAVHWTRQPHGRILLRMGNELYKIDNVKIEGQKVTFTVNGHWNTVVVKDEQELLLERLGFKTHTVISAGRVRAPMPGKILEIRVKQGDQVEPGDPVVILEAMKMENELKSPVAGIVETVDVQVNESVDKNQTLIEIKPRG
ncbi:MAG: acetyl-CoA carboxylase biotin carboxyl carrier protein subunit [Balneolaceae bacterium]